MSDHNPLAYGNDYSQSRGSGNNQQSGARGFLNSAFKQAKTQYDKYSQKPPQNFGYGSSATGQQQPGQQQYNQGQSQPSYQQPQQQQQQQPWGQPPQPGATQGQPQYSYGSTDQQSYQYGSQQPQQSYQPQQPMGGKPKADLASKLIGGLTGAVHTIGTDVGKLIGSQYPGSQQGTAASQAQQPGAAGQTRFGSFASPKADNQVKWYVDGCNYMWAVSQALENARQSVWILDWWLSPELYLRRPPAANEMWRLDRVLQRAAQRGVKINIIVYKEVTQALTLSSHHTKETLEKLSPNIAVFRHPDHLPDAKNTHSSILSSFQGMKLDAASASKLGSDAMKGVSGLGDNVILYWAHHEKLCLIDGQIAFMGGLDLCYGRWDTHQHSIADAHPSDLNKIVFPGQDFNNARVMDFNDVPNPFQNKLDRTKSSRMGWSDVSICLRGPCVEDLRTHFTDRWNFIYDEKYTVRKDVRYSKLAPTPGHVAGASSQTPQIAAVQQSVPTGQYPPPPGSQAYEPPAWQSTSTTATSGIVAAPSHSPQPQTFPPPPPGPPPQVDMTGQYNYSSQQQQGNPSQPNQPGFESSTHPNVTHQVPGYQDTSSSQTYGSQPQQQYSTPVGQQSFNNFPAPPVSQSPGPQQQYAPSPSVSPAPPLQQPTQQPQQQYGQTQPQFQTPPPSHSPAPQAPYQAYHGSGEQQPVQQQQQPPGAIELPAQQTSYNAYHPPEGTRGFSDQLPHFSQGHGHGFGHGHGQGQGASGGRFDQYKQEGKMLGNELGAIGSMLQGKVEQKMGRPVSRSGSSMRCQVLRSSSKWSNGTPTESSIQAAYIDVIEKSQHFVYIENQFFITATGDQQRPVKNLIGKALVERVVRAAREHTPFKVVVIMPAIPAFAGDFIDDASLGTRAICEFQYFSICRGGHSIMEEIQKAGVNPMDYIRFYNLRNYDRINFTAAQTQAQQQAGVNYEDARKQQENALGAGYAGQGYSTQSVGAGQWQGNPAQQYQAAAQQAPNMAADRWDSVASCYMLNGEDIRNVPWSGPPEAEIDAFVSEELYVHSKVIIADDQVVICGSANINDRSMQGNHDSEIALLIYDTTPQQSMMAGKPWQASRFAASLRRQLFRKHLGLIPPQDPARADVNGEPVQSPNAYDWGSPEDNLVTDPLAETFQSFWNTRARTNTEVFRKAFRAVPDDYVRSWAEYKEFFEYYFAKAGTDAASAEARNQAPARVEYGHVAKSDFPGGAKELKELLSRVKGTLVEMPLCFLQTEDIAKEGMGLNVWTQRVYT